MSISSEQRQLVRRRAGNCCEYCRVSQTGQLIGFQVDHIIAIKHGGTDTDDNLCLACYECNIYKGSNVAALDPLTRDATKLYDPRQQNWDDHFQINSDATLSGSTPEGRATIVVLRMNDEERVKQRLGELMTDDYPCHRDS
ncbi:MAG: HNH endonuclease [Anaerolineae bacterium]|nr:HNH endonuclease [Anaerolineae bacterium]